MDPVETELVRALALDEKIVRLVLELRELEWLSKDATSNSEPWMTVLRTADNRKTVGRLEGLSTAVLNEYVTRLIEDALKRNQWQKRFVRFTLDRHPERIEIVEKNRLGDQFFRFGLLGECENYWFGVGGPWNQAGTMKEISKLKTACKKRHAQEEWSDSAWRKRGLSWLWWCPCRDSKTAYQTAYRLARQGIDPSMVFDTYVEEFFEKCVPLIPLVQTINKELLSV